MLQTNTSSTEHQRVGFLKKKKLYLKNTQRGRLGTKYLCYLQYSSREMRLLGFES